MSNLPFDVFKPFKNKPEDFTPADNIPWATIAPQTLECSTETGFIGLRSFQLVKSQVEWLVNNLELVTNASILDVGCGPGMYSNALAAYGYQVTGIDIAQAFLDYAATEAKIKNLSCTYQHLSFTDMMFYAEFDVVLFINSTIGQLTESELIDTMGRIYKALKPGGQLICEIDIEPSDFKSMAPQVDENISFHAKSPWSNKFHSWFKRKLIFPQEGQLVDHHLILTEDGEAKEYWSRFIIYPIDYITVLLNDAGFKIKTMLDLNSLLPPKSSIKLRTIWAVKK